MLSESRIKECYDIVLSAIQCCNNNLNTNFNKVLEIDYKIIIDPIIHEVPFNAHSRLSNNSYSVEVDSRLFEMTFDVINTLLAEVNEMFFFMVSGDRQYDKYKANIYLDILYQFSVKLIIFHELGHIFNGHLLYKKDLNNIAECYMYMDSEHNELAPIESQVLEMDADAFAATMGIGQMTFDENIIYFNSFIPEMVKDKKHALILFIIASNIVFSIQGLGKKRQMKDYKTLRYLPLRARQDYYVRCALNAFKNYNSSEKLTFGNEILDIKFFREVLPNVEQYTNLYFQEAFGFEAEDYDMDNNRNELSQDILEHCNYLDRVWKNSMREKLSHYSYFKLAT